MEQLVTALELRAEAIAEEIDALETLAHELPEPYRARLRSILLRVGKSVVT